MTDNTRAMIDQLNGCEEVLAALDQVFDVGGSLHEFFRHSFHRLTDKLMVEIEGWNGDLSDGDEAVHRCKFAAKPYHTSADAPCDVWGLTDVCAKHGGSK